MQTWNRLFHITYESNADVFQFELMTSLYRETMFCYSLLILLVTYESLTIGTDLEA